MLHVADLHPSHLSCLLNGAFKSVLSANNGEGKSSDSKGKSRKIQGKCMELHLENLVRTLQLCGIKDVIACLQSSIILYFIVCP